VRKKVTDAAGRPVNVEERDRLYAVLSQDANMRLVRNVDFAAIRNLPAVLADK
jgi:hypothetical protein